MDERSAFAKEVLGMFRRFLFLGSAIALILIAASVTYFSVTYFFPPAEKPVSTVYQQIVSGSAGSDPLIKPGTIVRIETQYACGDVMTEFQGPANNELRGLTEKQVKELYSPEAGWEINRLSGGIIELSRSVEDLCDRHKEYRHLGIYQNMLAVYEGPLGYNESLLRVERNISMDSLPSEYRVKLEQAMDFDKQAASAKLELRRQFEFPNEQLMNTALDSIDEMKQGSAAR
jgi:hypothetical protein